MHRGLNPAAPQLAYGGWDGQTPEGLADWFS